MTRMTFSRPADSWYRSLPIGNGKTAVMVAGGIRKETLWFNDAEFWSGYPRDCDSARSQQALARIRETVAGGNYRQAHAETQSDMCGDYTQAYMPLGIVRLHIRAKGQDKSAYSRSLHMGEGVLRIDDGAIQRETFVSYPHQIAVYAMRAAQAFSVCIGASSPVKHRVDVKDGILTVSGNAPDYAAPNYLRTKLFPIRYNEKKAMAFCLALQVDTDGVLTTTKHGLKVSDATYMRLYAVTKTGFRGHANMPVTDAEAVRKDAVDALFQFRIPYDRLYREHVQDYKRLWEKQILTLQHTDGDVERLLRAARSGNTSAELIQILYDYGKYMTICGSRNAQPLNLQGQWNKSVRPPWSSNLTTNINAQMNYWGASRCGLEECLTPFYRAVDEIMQRGKHTASVHFGMRGFCCNHNVDIWRHTSPVQGNPSYMYAPLCGAWLANEVFAHKKNCGTIDAQATECIAQAAEFCLDYLWEHDGELVTCPSASPETEFDTPQGRSAIGIASAFEMDVIRQTFAFCLESGASDELKDRIRQALPRMRAHDRAENGLAEWAGGKMSAEKGHRHFSPLYGVYPGNVIRPNSEVFEWAYELFRYRMQHAHSAIGWSAAWAICLAGRFRDSAIAKRTVNNFAARSIMDNLFDYHPPCYFQIDGNMGFVAAMQELLLTERDGVITFLPACFDTIDHGEVRGMVVNGNVLDFVWENGKITYAAAKHPIRVEDSNISEHATLIQIEKVKA